MNKLAATAHPTPVVIRHAQCIDSSNIRVYTEDGRQFCLTVTEIE